MPAAATLPSIMAAAWAIRLAAIPAAGLYHPDELFQYLEQAFRSLHGFGVVPWEYRDGIRSWLFPLAIKPWMALGDRLAPASSLYLDLPRGVAATLSLSLVGSGWMFGRRAGPTHAAITALVIATWSGFIFMAPHLLTEAISASLIVPAAALLTGRDDAVRFLLGGLLLGLGVLLRIQHLPVALLFAAQCGSRNPRLLPALSAGGLIAILLSAAVDLHMGVPPFGWAIGYVDQNLVLGRAATYGTEPAASYLYAISATFGPWTLPVLLLARLGAKREPLLCLAALLNLLVHMAIGHKEYRFIWLTIVIIVMLAALGTGDLIEMLGARWRVPGRRAALLAIALWTTASATLAANGRLEQFSSHDGAGTALFAQLAQDHGRCGVALAGVHWSATGGYTYLRRPLPIFTYGPGELGHLSRDQAGFDTVVAGRTTIVPEAYHLERCAADPSGGPSLCIFGRTGGCASIASEAEIHRAMIRWQQ